MPNNMSLELSYTKEEWLEGVYQKSDSIKSKKAAIAAINSFELFTKHIHKQEPDSIIQTYRNALNQGKPDQVYLDLDRWVKFMNKDHEFTVKDSFGNEKKFKRKSPKTILTYFGFLKKYLRIVYGVKLDPDEIKIMIQFPKRIRESRKPITKPIIKQIIDHVKPSRRALYLTLLSSGIRIGEALALRKNDFHTHESPIRVTIRAQNTKTREERETYISSEAADKVLAILQNKSDDDLVFTDISDPEKALLSEERAFHHMRSRLAYTTKYDNANRYHITLHAFRSYFHTKASQKHGDEYANALDGHTGYLGQYYRLSDEERAQKYRELEPDLLIESIQSETQKNKDKIIISMQEEMKKMQDKIKRLELISK